MLKGGALLGRGRKKTILVFERRRAGEVRVAILGQHGNIHQVCATARCSV